MTKTILIKRLLILTRRRLGSLMERRTNRIFCISMQRTGTTSVGKFLRDFGFRWAGWPADEKNGWSISWYNGDYERIFSSFDFKTSNAFEDSPWWLPGFYKVLYHRFPKSKFILFTRDPDAWFRSMVNHSKGRIIGMSMLHCKIYRRETEYIELLESGAIDEIQENQIISQKTMKLVDHADHYKRIYRLHNMEVQAFFSKHAPDSLHVGQLEDTYKWRKLGKFLGLKVPNDYLCHENASNKGESSISNEYTHNA